MPEKRSLCFFLHYFCQGYIPLYVQIYANELCNYFDEVRMITNQRIITTDPELLQNKISIAFVKNEGYDVGMFYEAFKTINPDEYTQIACVNDSNILFGKLKPIFQWSKSQEVDFWGLVDSYEKPWFSTHSNNYHIQSHFLVFNKRAIHKLHDYLQCIDIEKFINERDRKILRRNVINDWEIGLSQYLLKQDLHSNTYINSKTFAKLHHCNKPINVTHKLYAEMITTGFPLIKKRLVLSESWKSMSTYRDHWIRLIREYGDPDWKLDQLINELQDIKAASTPKATNIIRTLFVALSSIYRFNQFLCMRIYGLKFSSFFTKTVRS